MERNLVNRFGRYFVAVCESSYFFDSSLLALLYDLYFEVLFVVRRLPSSMVTNALLGAFTVQAELGDYEPAEHGDDADYLIDMEFCPGQTPELINKIAQIHRTLRLVNPQPCRDSKLLQTNQLFLFCQ